MKTFHHVLLLLIIILFSSLNLHAQSAYNFPLPEFYGIYPIVDGKLCAVSFEKCNFKTVEVKTESKGIIKAFEMKQKVEFLIYGSDFVENPNALRLMANLFIRNYSKKFLFNVKPAESGVLNAWSDASDFSSSTDKGIFEQVKSIEFRIKPYKADSVILVPDRELTPGLYTFGKRLPPNFEVLSYFWIGEKSNAESMKCVDREGFDFGTYANHSYKVCGQVTGIDSDKTDEVTSNPAILKELLDISKELNEAGLKGDKTTFEKYLAENFTYTNVGMKKTLDRATYIASIKSDGPVKSYKCYDEKLSLKGEVALLGATCDYEVTQFSRVVKLQYFYISKFMKNEGKWKLLLMEARLLPNK